MDQGQVKTNAEHMHATLKAAGVQIDFKELLAGLEKVGLPASKDVLKGLLDQAVFPWLNATLQAATKANFMFSLALPLVSALEMAVDAQVDKIPDATPAAN